MVTFLLPLPHTRGLFLWFSLQKLIWVLEAKIHESVPPMKSGSLGRFSLSSSSMLSLQQFVHWPFMCSYHNPMVASTLSKLRLYISHPLIFSWWFPCGPNSLINLRRIMNIHLFSFFLVMRMVTMTAQQSRTRNQESEVHFSLMIPYDFCMFSPLYVLFLLPGMPFLFFTEL